jgi:hypothetical protein
MANDTRELTAEELAGVTGGTDVAGTADPCWVPLGGGEPPPSCQGAAPGAGGLGPIGQAFWQGFSSARPYGIRAAMFWGRVAAWKAMVGLVSKG